MAIELMAPTAAAVAAGTGKVVISKFRIPSTILVKGTLGGTESIAVVYSVDGGTTWETLYVNSAQVTLTNTNSAAKIDSCMTLSVSKATTANAVGVYVATPDSP